MTTPLLLRIDSGHEPQLIASGIFPSPHVMDAPLWIDGVNVEFRDGMVKKSPGWVLPQTGVLLFDDATGNFDDATGNFDDAGGQSPTFVGIGGTPVRGLFQQRLSTGENQLFWANVTNIFLSQGGAGASKGSGFTGRTDATQGNHATQWSFEAFGNWTLATNGIDTPQIYKGASFASLGGIGGVFSTAEIFRALGPFILAFNLSTGPTDFAWPKQDDPEVWDPVANATAGNLTIREMETAIIAAEPLGQGIAVYSENVMAIVTHVQSPFIFGYKVALVGIGAISKHSIVPVGRKHYGWGPEGIFVTDGVQFQNIDTPAIRKHLEDNLNTEQQSKVWGYYNKLLERIIWTYPKGSSSEPSEQIGYSPKNNSWTFGDEDWTAMLTKEVWNGPILADTTGGVFAGNNGVDANGSARSFTLTTKPLDAGDPDRVKYIDYMVLQIRDLAGTGVKFQVGTQEKITDTVVFTKAKLVQNGFEKEDIDLSSPFITIKLTGDKLADDFSLAGFALYGSPEGGVQ